jgi:ketosteroid isomerase-like protein
MREPRETALTFLHAYWRGDVATATSLLAPNATSRLPKSMSGEERNAPAAPTVEWMSKEMIPLFEPPGLGVDVRCVAVEGDTVLVEYVAAGTLKSGARYEGEYVIGVTTAGELVTEMRPYGDTTYMSKMLGI